MYSILLNRYFIEKNMYGFFVWAFHDERGRVFINVEDSWMGVQFGSVLLLAKREWNSPKNSYNDIVFNSYR